MQTPPAQARKRDLFDYATSVWRFGKLLTYDPIKEIIIGVKTNALPTYFCLIIGIIINLFMLFAVDGWIFHFFHKETLLIPAGRFRNWFCSFSIFYGFIGWTLYRVILRKQTQKKIERVAINAGLETKLQERPVFFSDYPIDEGARKLTLRTNGLPVSDFMKAKDHLESNLNVYVSKTECPGGNREYVDIIYTVLPMPDVWTIENLRSYRDFSFPVGRSIVGEVKASLKDIPHFLVAGESGGGKSTFLRMMLTTLLANNTDLEVYYLDFKEGMENQAFSGFDNLKTIDTVETAAVEMASVKKILEDRMKKFKDAKARSIEMYNKSPSRRGNRENRIVVVVDEIAELMPTFKGKANSEVTQINAVLSKISRMGRAVGISLVVGVQKPDARNLDPTIKFNLNGVVCFPVSHFTQSTIALGNGRAADLNSEYKGRAIWKHGNQMLEVQTPLLTEEEVDDVKAKIQRFWGNKKTKDTPREKILDKDSQSNSGGAADPQMGVDVEDSHASDSSNAGA